MECKGRRVTFRLEEVELPNGHRMRIDRVIFPNAVAVLPVFRIGKIALIRQYRPVIRKYILEAPAGVISQGETPIEAARRELKEETGFHGGKLIPVGQGYTTPGYSTEKLYLYLALDPEKGEAAPEEHEIINLEYHDIDTALTMIGTGEIEDIKTIALILAADRFLKENSK